MAALGGIFGGEKTGKKPVIQTFSLSNGIRFQRICIVRAVVTSPPK